MISLFYALAYYSRTVVCCFVLCEELYLQLLLMTFMFNILIPINIGTIWTVNPLNPEHAALDWVAREFVVGGSYQCSGRHWVGCSCGCVAGDSIMEEKVCVYTCCIQTLLLHIIILLPCTESGNAWSFCKVFSGNARTSRPGLLAKCKRSPGSWRLVPYHRPV